MTSKSLLCATVASALLLTGAVTGCGGDGDTSPATGAPPFSTTTGSGGTAKEDGNGGNGAGKTGNGPASANDSSKDAPDNAISDRPGGPNAGPPVSPAPAK